MCIIISIIFYTDAGVASKPAAHLQGDQVERGGKLGHRRRLHYGVPHLQELDQRAVHQLPEHERPQQDVPAGGGALPAHLPPPLHRDLAQEQQELSLRGLQDALEQQQDQGQHANCIRLIRLLLIYSHSISSTRAWGMTGALDIFVMDCYSIAGARILMLLYNIADERAEQRRRVLCA